MQEKSNRPRFVDKITLGVESSLWTKILLEKRSEHRGFPEKRTTVSVVKLWQKGQGRLIKSTSQSTTLEMNSLGA